jgi:membrane associated rhomboid family serine protease
MNAFPAPEGRQPLLNAAPVALGVAVAIILLHALTVLAGPAEQIRIAYDFALAPRRFFAEPGSDLAYSSDLHAWLTLLSCALLHGDWMHALVNALMILAFGTPVARAFGDAPAGPLKWMLLFVVSVVCGSLAYLGLNGANGGAAIGASGGALGLMAAAFMLTDPDGASFVSRRFLTLSAGVAVANLIFSATSVFLIGVAIAWEAHLGGYLGGAVCAWTVARAGYRR